MEGNIQAGQVSDGHRRFRRGGDVGFGGDRTGRRSWRALGGFLAAGCPLLGQPCCALLVLVSLADPGQSFDQPIHHWPAADKPPERIIRIEQPVLLEHGPGTCDVALACQGKRRQQCHGLVWLELPFETPQKAHRPVRLLRHQGRKGGH